MTVFVAAQETMVIGVFSTKEKAQAAADEWSADAVEKLRWHRYDGAWQRYIKYADSDQMVLLVSEHEVDA